MFITSFGEQNITYKCCSNFLIHLSLQLSKHRPESISLKSVDLEAINHSQSNAAYAVTTAIVSNINEQDKVASSYYLGVGSGRICDQKNSKFSYEEFIEWIDHINILFAANQQTKSAFLNSYSQAVEYLPTEDPTLCILDLTDISGLIEVGYNGFRQNIDNTFIYKRYNRGISFFNLYYHPDDDTINKLENFISFEFNEKKEIHAICDTDLEFFIDNQKVELKEIFNNITVQLLFRDGTTFSHGHFFKHRLPTEKNELNHNIVNNIIPLPCLLKPNRGGPTCLNN